MDLKLIKTRFDGLQQTIDGANSLTTDLLQVPREGELVTILDHEYIVEIVHWRFYTPEENEYTQFNAYAVVLLSVSN